MSVRLTYHNLAKPTRKNRPIIEWVEGHVVPMLTSTRADRIVLETDRWLRFWRMWNVELDQQSYQGRSRVYLPIVRNAIETWVQALMQALFPFSDWFDVAAKRTGPLGGIGNAMAEKALQREQLQRMEIERIIEPAVRQYCTLGTGVLFHGWTDDEQVERFYERVQADAPPEDDEETTVIREETEEEHDDEALTFTTTRGTKVRLVEKSVKKYYGPQLRAVDLFHFFMAPTTSRNVDEAELCFEDMTVSLDHVSEMGATHMDYKHPEQGMLYENLDEMFETGGRYKKGHTGGKVPTDVQRMDDERRSRDGLEQDPNVAFADLEQGFVNLSNCRWRGEIPGAKDPQTGKEYGCIDWKVCVVNDAWVVALYPNPSYRKRRPWHVAKLIEVINECYGRGLVEAPASMQYAANDVGNLTVDSAVDALNPIVIVNDDLVTNYDSLQMAPRAKWFFNGAPNDAVHFITPPNVTAIGQSMMNLMIGLAQDASMTNFAVQGVPAPRGRGRAQNTATGMAQLAAAGSAGMRAALTRLEKQWMVPILKTNYEMQEQFMSDRMLIVMGGEKGSPLIEKEIGFEDVVGDYVFTWKGAQQVQERMALTQGLQGVVGLMAQIRASDPEAAASFRIKFGPIFKRILTDALGVAWADEVIETPEDERSMDPVLELDLLANHRPVDPQAGDDDAGHLEVQLSALQAEPFLSDPIARQMLMAHCEKHVAQGQAKQAAAQQQAMMQAMMQMQGGGGMGTPSGPQTAGQGGMAQLTSAMSQPEGMPNS